MNNKGKTVVITNQENAKLWIYRIGFTETPMFAILTKRTGEPFYFSLDEKDEIINAINTVTNI